MKNAVLEICKFCIPQWKRRKTFFNCFMNGFIETKNYRLLETRNYRLQVKLETIHYRTPSNCVIRTSISKQ